MYTAEEVDALRERLEREGTRRPEIVKKMAWACVGWPYVFGAAGEMCTPEVRRKYAGYHAEYAENIRRACPVLSGKQGDCAQCQWLDTRCFDCRGFTRWLLAQAGLDLAGAGATRQWETKSNWAVMGEIGALPAGFVCVVFKRRDGKMSHTGMHVGDGEIVHCSTTVKPDALPGRPAWTHWAIPAGLYSTYELRKAGYDVGWGTNMPTIRRGATGDLVELLQECLNEQTGAGLEVDGKFGAKTEAAVIHFQALHDLKEDGIVGPRTWEAMGGAPDEDDFSYPPMEGPIGDPEEWDDDPEEPEEKTVEVPVTALKLLYVEMHEMEKALLELMGEKEPP